MRYFLCLIPFFLGACTSLDIGHNKFYCQEKDSNCVNASTYLSQNPKQVAYSQLTQDRAVRAPQVLLNASPDLNTYLKIWFAPNSIGAKVYPSRLILIPYLR